MPFAASHGSIQTLWKSVMDTILLEQVHAVNLASRTTQSASAFQAATTRNKPRAFAWEEKRLEVWAAREIDLPDDLCPAGNRHAPEIGAKNKMGFRKRRQSPASSALNLSVIGARLNLPAC